jgi:hypothetical protein
VHLPNADRAVVQIEKLRDYCVSLDHPKGRHKARVFAAVLGLFAPDAGMLQSAILRAALIGDAVATEYDQYGQRYVLDFAMPGLTAQATIRTSWIIRHDEDFPRLTSCYVL